MSHAQAKSTLGLALEHHQAGRLQQAELLYRQILTADPRSADALHYLGVIALQVGSHRNDALDLLQRAGIAPERVTFSERDSRSRYFDCYHQIDIGLDTFPYNGHTTSLDSLWMGVPVVTLIGGTVVGRAGWSQLSNLGLTEFAAHDTAQFIGIARRWAGDLARLAELRRTLRERMKSSPLMDARRFTLGVEDAYRSMWRAWCASAGR